MKKNIFVLISIILTISKVSAQNPSIVPDNLTAAYIDYIFSNDEVLETTEKYKSQVPKFELPINLNALKEDLYLDLYYHSIQNSACIELSPLIIFAPASGNNRTDVKYIARDLARRGYIVASITTRNASATWLTNNYLNVNKAEVHPLLTYTAATDLHSAINYLITQRAGIFKIHPNYVIVAGGSFGAITALHAAFMDRTEANNLFGSLSDVNSTYFSDFSESIQNNNIKGVVSLYGGLYDLSLIKASEAKPVFMYHGNRDPYVPYKTNYFFYTSGNPMMSGSAVIAEKIKNNNHSYSLVIGDNVGHTYKPMCGYTNISFPLGYPMNWYPEMLSFLKNSVCALI
jgi:dienelactone hydrolase